MDYTFLWSDQEEGILIRQVQVINVYQPSMMYNHQLHKKRTNDINSQGRSTKDKSKFTYLENQEMRQHAFCSFFHESNGLARHEWTQESWHIRGFL